eukprot:4281437-Prymnesium_polylepis.1
MGSSTWAGLSGYCLIVIVIAARDVLRAQRERRTDTGLQHTPKRASLRCRWTSCCASHRALRTQRALRT